MTRVVDLVASYEERRLPKHGQTGRLVRALQPEIEEALNRGFSVYAIWAALHEAGRVDAKYQAFARVVAKHGLTPLSKRRNQSPPAAAPELPALPPFTFPRPESGARTFEHNPRPQKKDL